MPDNNVIANQFTGLPMASLIGGPLQAVADAQLSLANTTRDFIETVGFNKVTTKDAQNNEIIKTELRTVEFAYTKMEKVFDKANDKYNDNPVEMSLKVPFISIVKVPSLFVDSVDITFDMEVKTSEEQKESSHKEGSLDATASLGIGPFSIKATIKGSISSHKENTRKTDTSAKYHVEVHASDQGMPEGLARVLDILNSTIIPQEKTTEETKQKQINNKK